MEKIIKKYMGGFAALLYKIVYILSLLAQNPGFVYHIHKKSDSGLKAPILVLREKTPTLLDKKLSLGDPISRLREANYTLKDPKLSLIVGNFLLKDRPPILKERKLRLWELKLAY